MFSLYPLRRRVARHGCVVLPVPALFCSVLRATTMLTDFGQSGAYEMHVDSSGRRWNNLSSSAIPGAVVPLLDTTGRESGITLTLVRAFNLGDYNTNGDTGSAGLPYDAGATRDSLFGNAGLFGGQSNVVPELKFSGLDPGLACELTFFASRSATDNRIARYTVAGATTASVFLDANGPAPHTVTLSGVMPRADGTIAITVNHSTVAESGLPARGTGDNATGFAYLGVLELRCADTLGPPPAPARALTILPLGSSITAGQTAQSPYNGGGYRTPLYHALKNDGRFVPAFVGSSTTLMANSPLAANYLTSAGQLAHEGHPGYTTAQVLGNLEANDGSGGNNGGYWLVRGNGREPDFITLNIGGNDFVKNASDATAIQRLDQLVGRLAALRPSATIVVSSIVWRPDVGAGIDAYYNAYLPDLVLEHALAGRHVRYLDLRAIMGTAYLSSDSVHPTQDGYDLMGRAWYAAIARGAAYWTGAAGGAWNTVRTDGVSNWATDRSLLSDRGEAPDGQSDVFFNTRAGSVALGANAAACGLRFFAGADIPVVIGSGPTLEIGAGGLAVQAGSGAHRLECDVSLSADQTWACEGGSLTVGGKISNPRTLRLRGAGGFCLQSDIAGGGTVAVTGAPLIASGTWSVTLALGAGALLDPGSAAGPGRLRTGAQTWAGGTSYRWRMADADGAAGAGYSTLQVDGRLDLSGVTAATPAKLIASPATEGGAANFSPERSYAWTIATATESISGFDPAAWQIDASGFSPTPSGGAFALAREGNALVLRFTPASTPLSRWRAGFFGAPDNFGSGADLADPDGDGAPNLLEYALGTDPTLGASRPRAPVSTRTVADGARLELRFTPIPDNALTYEVEACDDLAGGAWTAIWSAAGASLAPEEIAVIDPRPVAVAAQRFLRLRVRR